MLFRNFLVRERIVVVSFLRESRSWSLGARVRLSFVASSGTWVHDNELFQRHPRLQVLEQQCKKTFRHLGQILAYVIVSGLHRNPFVMSRVLHLSLFGLEEEDELEKSKFGVRIFRKIENPNVFSWNTSIRFFAEFCPATAVNSYIEMLRGGRLPDSYTFPFLLQACGVFPDLGTVKQIHCHAVKLFTEYNLFMQNSLLNAYLICSSLTDAQLVFDELPQKDVVSWTTIISRLASQANYEEAVHFFRKMMADDLQQRPNAATLVSTMSACGGLGSILLTKCLHALLEKVGWQEADISVMNSLIDAYAKCGDLDSASMLFDYTHDSKRDLYSWTAIISGYAMHGQGLEALKMFLKLEQGCGLIPDEVTYYAVLSGCAHSGLVKEGMRIFHSMAQPDLKHYGCIVDLLGRAGMLDQAFEIVQNMPMEPNLAVLGSLLSNCTLHNNVRMSKDLLRRIKLLNQRDEGGAPVLLSNVYAAERQWGEVMRIRKEMRQNIWSKPAGRSWIQVKDGFFGFVARNEATEPETRELIEVLQGLEKISRLC